jgi:hypothetical protein
MGGNETMTKRFTVDEKGYFDKKAMRYVTIDYLMDLVNEQDQQIKDIEKLLDDELEKASINRERWDEPHPAAEYFKGYHCGVGDLKKKIRHILFNE